MESAGVETGAKMLVGLRAEREEAAQPDVAGMSKDADKIRAAARVCELLFRWKGRIVRLQKYVDDSCISRPIRNDAVLQSIAQLERSQVQRMPNMTGQLSAIRHHLTAGGLNNPFSEPKCSASFVARLE